ncbi:MAG: adenylate/guanylate cyclase domain-containing protein [Desulfobacterales bacterium]
MKADSILSKKLPERVREAILNQQNESEILIGWFQLAVVSLYGILAAFGAAVPSDTYAADALRTTDAVLAAVELWNAKLTADGRPQIRVGAAVSTGNIIFGAVGDADRLEYTVIGGAVNLCAKLEKHNKTEKVRALTTQTAYTLAFQQGYRLLGEDRQLRQRRVEGVDDSVGLVVLAF